MRVGKRERIRSLSCVGGEDIQNQSMPTSASARRGLGAHLVALLHQIGDRGRAENFLTPLEGERRLSHRSRAQAREAHARLRDWVSSRSASTREEADLDRIPIVLAAVEESLGVDHCATVLVVFLSQVQTVMESEFVSRTASRVRARAGKARRWCSEGWETCGGIRYTHSKAASDGVAHSLHPLALADG